MDAINTTFCTLHSFFREEQLFKNTSFEFLNEKVNAGNFLINIRILIDSHD